MSHYNVPIRQGTLVTVKDGSYMLAICPETNTLTHFPKIHEFDYNIPKLGHTYIVIAVNVPCPQEKDILGSLHASNNCIIKDTNNGVIWFCSKLNLKTQKNLLTL